MNPMKINSFGWSATQDDLDWLEDVSDAAEANHPGGLLHIRNHVSKIDKSGYGGRVQHLTLNHKFDYLETVRRSIKLCPTVNDIVTTCLAADGDKALAQRAWDQQMSSWEKTLLTGPSGSNYVSIAPGVQVHPDAPGDVYIMGLWVCRALVSVGNPKPPTKSRPLTLVKAWIRDQVPVGRVRQPRLSAGSFDYLAVAGQKLFTP